MRVTHPLSGGVIRKGDYYHECAVCGKDYWRSELMVRYDGALVCYEDYDSRNPADDTPRLEYEHPVRLR